MCSLGWMVAAWSAELNAQSPATGLRALGSLGSRSAGDSAASMMGAMLPPICVRRPASPPACWYRSRHRVSIFHRHSRFRSQSPSASSYGEGSYPISHCAACEVRERKSSDTGLIARRRRLLTPPLSVWACCAVNPQTCSCKDRARESMWCIVFWECIFTGYCRVPSLMWPWACQTSLAPRPLAPLRAFRRELRFALPRRLCRDGRLALQHGPRDPGAAWQ